MGRSGYSEYDGDDAESQWAYIRARGATASALRGHRGQRFLRRLAEALDSMPVKALCRIPTASDGPLDTKTWKRIPPPGADRLGLPDGRVCVLGAIVRASGGNSAEVDATDHDGLGRMLDIAPRIVRELEWMNDDRYADVGDDAARWKYLREWVSEHINTEGARP